MAETFQRAPVKGCSDAGLEKQRTPGKQRALVFPLRRRGDARAGAEGLCLGCELHSECFEEALTRDQRFGIWSESFRAAAPAILGQAGSRQ